MKFEFVDDESKSKYDFDFTNYSKTKKVSVVCHTCNTSSENFLQPYLSKSFVRSIKNKKVLWFGNDLMLMSQAARTYCQKIINNLAFL